MADSILVVLFFQVLALVRVDTVLAYLVLEVEVGVMVVPWA